MVADTHLMFVDSSVTDMHSQGCRNAHPKTADSHVFMVSTEHKGTPGPCPWIQVVGISCPKAPHHLATASRVHMRWGLTGLWNRGNLQILPGFTSYP